MEDENAPTKLKTEEGANELVRLLTSFVQDGPNPDVEHKLTLFHGQHYLTVLMDTNTPRDIRVACCSALKSALNHRQAFQTGFELILGSVEAMYVSGSQQLASPLGMVLQKLFELYLDDEKRLQAFEGIIDRIAANNDINNGAVSERALQIGMMLIRAMQPSTLNNQICVGGLFCYLKQIYYPKNQTNSPSNPNGRGIELMLEAMQHKQLQKQMLTFVEIQIEIVKLISEIVNKVEQEQMQEMEAIPASYIRNSNQICDLLTKIVCTTNTNKVFGVNEKINQLKLQTLQLYSQNYMYRLQKPFLLAALSTITNTNVQELNDSSMQIISQLLQLIQRSTSYPDYSQIFYNVTQVLVLKLFELSSARDAEKDALENDPQYFAQIAEDYCKTQESQTMKARAGSLLYNLCMYVDGNLTFIANFALVSLLDLQRRAIAAIDPSCEMRPDAIKSQSAMKTLMDLWSFSAQSFTQTSIIVLSCISDLLARRAQFDANIRIHIFSMLKLFRHRDKVLQFFPVIVICRYIQLISYFSGAGCLDPFIPLFQKHEGIAQCLLKGLQTVIQFHDKKNQEMTNYVTKVSSQILLLPDKLTSQLETTIVTRPALLQCVKEKLIEKLVVWLLHYLNNENRFGCNKISNLLVKSINYYPDYVAKNDEDLFKFQLEALAQYLAPLYRFLMTGKYRQSEQCVVEVAVAHAQILKTSLSQQMATDFLNLGSAVVDKNAGVLNKCLELFSHLLGTQHMKTLIQQPLYAQLRKVNLKVSEQLLIKAQQWLNIVQGREDNIWQLACLIELCLCNFEVTSQKINTTHMDFKRIFNKCRQTYSQLLLIKAFSIAFLCQQLNPQPNSQHQKWVKHISMPQQIPLWQKNHLTIYILRSVCRFSLPEVRAKLVVNALALLLPGQQLRRYLTNYDAKIHCLGGTSQCEVMAFQVSKEIRHPLECWPSDGFEQFKEMFHRMGNWEPLRKYFTKENEESIRQALQMKTVGSRVRRIVKVKPPRHIR